MTRCDVSMLVDNEVISQSVGCEYSSQHPVHSSSIDLFDKTPRVQPFRSGFTPPLGNSQQALSNSERY
jgi:hypothetical protein